QNAATLKEEANCAVRASPETAAVHCALLVRVQALDGIQVPEVNDQDGNGRADDLDAAVAAATAAVEAAEAADQAAKDKLAELNADNLRPEIGRAPRRAREQNSEVPEA
uniref:GA-like domain-containing protein n=1 Tax=Escherichia coli TaxID=562 RepID=UPI003967CC0D